MAAAVSIDVDDDLKALTSRDISELRAYFRDSAANVGGLKGIDYAAKLGGASGGSDDHERITDKMIAAAGRGRRVERVRDRMPGGAWSVLATAYGEPRHEFPAGVPEDVASLLSATETALGWGDDLVREADAEEAARRAYAAARLEGATPYAVTARVWAAMASVERTHIDASRARDAAVERMVLVAGTLPSKRKKQDAKKFEAALVEAEGDLARAGHEFVTARQAGGVHHIEDRRDDEARRERDAWRGLSSRVRLLAARPEAAE